MALHRRSRHLSGDDAGLTLVEVMVAMVLFVLGSLSLLSVLASSLTGTFDNRARLTATNLAASDIDEARSLDYFALAPADYTRTVDGRSYRVVREVVITTAPGSSTSACVGSGGVKAFHKKVSTQVTTAFRGATTKAVRADTLVDAPLYDPNSTSGALGFTVLDRTSTPLSSLPVAIPGHNRTTDSRGCAFFDGLTPGDYTVTVTRSGSVTRAGSTTLSKTVKVTAGRITADSLRVDTAVPFTVFMEAHNGTSVVTGFSRPTGSFASIAASDRSNVARLTYTPKLVTRWDDTTWSAFPAPGGYAAWFGTCTPLVAHAHAEPGTSPRVPLQLSPVSVKLVGSNGGDDWKAQNRTVQLSYAGTPSCTETVSYANTATPANCVSNSSGSNECWLYIAVPPGTWNFKVKDLTYNTTATIGTRTAANVQINVS